MNIDQPAVQPDVTIEDFLKIDIRAGVITSAERVPRSRKLIKLVVDFGHVIGYRQILAGIGEHFTPEKLLGLAAAFVVNLPPREMMGLQSHGMILAASNKQDAPGVSLTLLGPDMLNVELGARIG